MATPQPAHEQALKRIGHQQQTVEARELPVVVGNLAQRQIQPVAIFCLRGALTQKHAPATTQTMPQTQAKAPAQPRLLQRIVARLVVIAVVGGFFFWVVQRSSARLDAGTEPAGLARGLLHGALMPLALPNLLIGRDPTIYAPNNTGRLYKLGYTAGVNGCGLVFFGFFFWRLNRIRRRLLEREHQGESSRGQSVTELRIEN